MPFDAPRSSSSEPLTTMATNILLCADSEVLAHGELIGLPGVRLERLPWLRLCASGTVARRLLAEQAAGFQEIWVVSGDDIEGINLAAAIVFDHPKLPVYLICERPSGSLLSRAQSAGITATLTIPAFVQRFEETRWRVEAPMTNMTNVGVGAGSAPESTFSRSERFNPRHAATEPTREERRGWPEADPDPFGIDALEHPRPTDQAMRLSIERLRSIALAPDPSSEPPQPNVPFAETPPSATVARPAAQTPPTRFAPAAATPLTSAPAPVSVPAEPAQTALFALTPASASAPSPSPMTPLSLTSSAPNVAASNAAPMTHSAQAAALQVPTQPTCVQTAMRPAARKRTGPPPAQNGFLISVLSGSGGAGKSTVSALVAARIARQGLNVALIDCDLQFGDMAAFFGERNAVTVDKILADGRIDPDARPRPGTPFVIAAPGHVEQSEMVDIDRLLTIVLPRFDVVVANTGAGWGDAHAYLMENSARVLFVVDQRASSVRACLHGLDLCRRCGIASGSFLYVLNRCSKSAPFTSIDLSCALKGASVAELAEGGMEVEELLGSGMALELAESTNPIVDSIAAMLETLLPERLAALADARRTETDGGRGFRRKKSPRRRRKRGKDTPSEAMIHESY